MRRPLTLLAAFGIGATITTVVTAQSDEPDTVLVCEDVDLDEAARTLEALCSTRPYTPPTTTTVSPATTTTAPATTSSTSAPTTSSSSSTTSTVPSGSGFAADFDSAADLAPFTLSAFSSDRDTQWGPVDVRVEGGRLVNECGAQNYGDCVLRLDRLWSGSTLSFDLATNANGNGYAEMIFTDRPYAVSAFNDENNWGGKPANGFAIYPRCPDVQVRTWVNYAETMSGGPAPCGSLGPNATAGRHYEVTRSGATVVVKVDGNTARTFTSPVVGPLWINFGTHNHATEKYGSGPTYTTSWDNLALDAVAAPNGCWLVLNANVYGVDSTTDASRLNYTIAGGPSGSVPFQREFHQLPLAFTWSIPLSPCPAAGSAVTVAAPGVNAFEPKNVQLVNPGGTPSTTSTTTAPTATTTTVAPTTTVVSSSTSTPSTTSSTLAPTTTTTQPTTTTTQPPLPQGVLFSESFETPEGFYDRFDFGLSAKGREDPATFGDAILDYEGDHNAMCSGPDLRRNVHLHTGMGPITPTQVTNQTGKSQMFWWCAPGDDPTKGHLMTGTNGPGYQIAYFSPKQIFTNVNRVCWNQNLTTMDSKWTNVVIAPVADVEAVRARKGWLDLGFDPPGFQDPNGPTTEVVSPNGVGVKVLNDHISYWQGHDFVNGEDIGPSPDWNDKATRYRVCMVDNGNGTVTVSRGGSDGGKTRTVPGAFPNGQVRVVFEDDMYDPPKRAGYDPTTLTFHWDAIEIAS